MATKPGPAKRPTQTLGKFTRPRPVGALLRERLFDALDQARLHPAVWVAGPPGAGKTTLISTYVAKHRVRTVWYRIKDDDADPATFFHYFRLAVEAGMRGRGAALPQLTPEGLLDLPAFSRRYFEEVFRRLKAPSVLVLDNYQEVPPEAPLHEVLCEALECLPAGVNVIMLSRAEPPPALAPLRARGTVAFLGGDDLKLTAEECGEIARLRAIRIEKAALQQLYERTQGWTAGVVLALEQKAPAAGSDLLPVGATPQVVFDYFAGEIFAHMPGEAREVLLQAAFLPSMAGHRVVELTGDARAQRVLAELARTNYFTLKLAQVDGAPPAVYQFHPLFREFLLRRAEETLAAATLVRVKQKAAALLEAEGETAEAIVLFIAAEAWGEALRVMHARAPQMLEQGRGRVLEAWLRALPAWLREQSPWALYWLGRCRLGYDPAEARRHFEQAFTLFEQEDDAAAGLFTVLAGIVDTFFFEWGEFASLDHWIEVLDGLLARYPKRPLEIEARVACSMFSALMYRQPQRADLPQWAERVRSIAVNAPDGRTRMLLGDQLMHYYTSWNGDIAAARLLLDSLGRPKDAADFGPRAHIAWCAMEADYHWHSGAHEECQRRVREGAETARRFGTQFAGSRLQAHGVSDSLVTGDFATADKMLKSAVGALSGGRLIYRAHYHFLASLAAFSQKDAVHAVASVREAVALADQAGVPLLQALYRLGLARALYASGQRREALAHLARAHRIARRIRVFTIEFSCLSLSIYFMLKRGKQRLAVPFLRKAFEVSKQRGYVNRAFWTPAFMRRMFAAALEHGIEVPYVQDCIRRHKLAPPQEALHLDWPFPVKIYTLGRFSVLLEGKPLQFSGKAQRKPLELLMALVAFGGREVSERQLTEALWPDAEGDAAHQACAAALHRLRKLLGCDQAISLQRNHLSLDARFVWVDTWAFERALAADAQSATRATALYHGPFLGKDVDLQWALAPRERLRVKFMRHLAEHGRRLFEARRFDEAVALFEKGLAVDPLAEEFYRQLMACYQALDLRAEAIGVYRRCESALAAALGLSPAAKTTALYQALQGGSR